MLQLFYSPGTASQAPHILLNELGVPFELKKVDKDNNAHKSPEYLKLNPNGLIPVLVDGDLVLYECVAIGLHLVDTHPQARLAPPLGTPARAELYKWLVWMTNTLQTTLLHYFYPERPVAPDNAAGAAEVKEQAQVRLGQLLPMLDQQVADSGGPWLLGTEYSMADAYAFMFCRWTRNTRYPARDFPHLGPYLKRLMERPAVQRMIEVEKLSAPLI